MPDTPELGRIRQTRCEGCGGTEHARDFGSTNAYIECLVRRIGHLQSLQTLKDYADFVKMREENRKLPKSAHEKLYLGIKKGPIQRLSPSPEAIQAALDRIQAERNLEP